MAKRSFQVPTYSPAAVADTTGFTAAGYLAIGASSATAGLEIIEVKIDGLASASTVMLMMLARDSTIAVGPSALAAPNSDGPFSTLTAALAAPSLTFVTVATTQPQRSALTTAARLNFGINAFGGVQRWAAAPGEQWIIIGVTASLSESSMSNFTGGATGAISTTLVYEPY